MSVLQELFTENPMLIEVKRMQRKFLGMERANSMATVVLVLAGMAYLGLLMIVWYYRADVDPIMLIYLQTGLFLIVGPAMLHGVIAGERERRSWDLLLVAPITKAQIVAGKFVGALSALAGGVVLFLLPVLIASVSYSPAFANPEGRSTWSKVYDLLLLEAVSISFLVFVCSLTLLLSARAKRSFVALGASIGTLVTLLMVFPLMISVVFAQSIGDRVKADLIMGLHPFYVLNRIHEISGDSVRMATDYSTYSGVNIAAMPNSFFGWPQVIVYLLFSVVLLAWAERTLRFADSEAGFVGRRKNA